MCTNRKEINWYLTNFWQIKMQNINLPSKKSFPQSSYTLLFIATYYCNRYHFIFHASQGENVPACQMFKILQLCSYLSGHSGAQLVDLNHIDPIMANFLRAPSFSVCVASLDCWRNRFDFSWVFFCKRVFQQLQRKF